MKLPSLEMLKCFIRANTENLWAKDDSPWVVKVASNTVFFQTVFSNEKFSSTKARQLVRLWYLNVSFFPFCEGKERNNYALKVI